MSAPTLSECELAARDGLLSVSERGPLALYHYTPKCAYDRIWTPVTRAARGLIFDRRDGACVARPFPKFFNLGEMPETQPQALPSTPFRVEEKLDGSLGILFFHEGRWDITTKGAFGSEQGAYAREELLPRYDLSWLHPSWTLLVEIIYPENRIVVDYGDRRELVLLSVVYGSGMEAARAVRAVTARSTGMREVESHAHQNILELPFQENQEGYVVRFEDGTRVKIKSPRYVQIHRLLEYRTPRRILDLIASGEYDDVRAQIPVELAGDFDDVGASLRMALGQVQGEALRVFEECMPLAEDRKAFAMAAKRKASSRALPLVFALLDGRETEELAIKAVRREL